MSRFCARPARARRAAASPSGGRDAEVALPRPGADRRRRRSPARRRRRACRPARRAAPTRSTGTRRTRPPRPARRAARPQARPGGPRQREHDGVGLPGHVEAAATQRPPERAVDRRGTGRRAPSSPSTRTVVRRAAGRPGWCRSGRGCAAAPSCPGTSPAAASRRTAASASPPRPTGRAQSAPRWASMPPPPAASRARGQPHRPAGSVRPRRARHVTRAAVDRDTWSPPGTSPCGGAGRVTPSPRPARGAARARTAPARSGSPPRWMSEQDRRQRDGEHLDPELERLHVRDPAHAADGHVEAHDRRPPRRRRPSTARRSTSPSVSPAPLSCGTR